jgi:hypothetical protein
MSHYDFPHRFRALYEQAVARYASGQRNPGEMFSADEADFLSTNGLTAQHLYDYAEDHHNYDGDPGPDQALAIELVRRDYFLNVQDGRPSAVRIEMDQLPAKTDTVRGIAWLPRLLPKARAKLRGELPASLMYCCGGDRRFFKEHNILPAELLTVLWRHENDDVAVVDWVVRRTELPTEATRVASTREAV